MKKMIVVKFAIGLLVLLSFLICTPLPVDNDQGQFPIKLSLEQEGRTLAVYSGQPITAIVNVNDTISFNDIAWHSGMGYYHADDSTVLGKRTHFEAELTWKRFPQKKDTSCNCYYDTMFVSIGGNIRISNSVRINVINLPPFIDSVRVNTSSYSGQDTLFSYLVRDTNKTITIRVFALDLDTKTPILTWNGDHGRITQSAQNLYTLFYAVPVGDFRDTIQLRIYDGQGGQVIRPLILYRKSPNAAPALDSVIVGTWRLKGSASVYQAGFVAFDTIHLRAYAHDNDTGDIITYSWSARKNTRLQSDPSSPSQALYICTSEICNDTISDTIIYLDTLGVKMTDSKGDFTSKQIILIKGKLNSAPVIDSIRFNDSLYRPTDTTIVVSIVGPKSYPIRVFTHDIDMNPVKLSWSLDVTSRITSKTDTSALYTSSDKIYNDTLHIFANDNSASTHMRLIIHCAQQVPVFDSLTANRISFKGIDTVYTYDSGLKDTVRFQIYARYKGSPDSVKYAWTSSNGMRSSSIGTRSVYNAPATATVDTIGIAMLGGNLQVSKKVIIKTSSHAPVIDSFIVDSARTLKGSMQPYQDSLSGKDTVVINGFAHDLDRGEALQFFWNSSQKNSSVVDLVGNDGTIITYRTKDSTYVDTLSLEVRDPKSNSTKKKIVFQVTK